MRKILTFCKTFVLVAAFAVAAVTVASAQVQTIHPDGEVPLIFLGESPALRDLPEIVIPPQGQRGPMIEHENESLENNWMENIIENPDALPKGEDPVRQKSVSNFGGGSGDHTTAWTTVVTNLTGLSASVEPSDNNMAVGPNHVVQITNYNPSAVMRIWNKSSIGTHQDKSVSGITGISDYGDPNIIYDQQADRFVLVVLYGLSSNSLIVCISKTPDPTGAWYYYTFNDNTGFPDYPKIAVWDSSYIITTNSTKPTIHCLNRTTMLTGGGTGTVQYFTMNKFGAIGFQTASVVTQTGANPPAPGTPATVLRMYDDGWGTGVDHLEIYRVHIDWHTPSNSSMTGPTNLNTAAFNSKVGSCSFMQRQCVPMPNSSTLLDPMGNIILDKAQYRNFGSYQSMLCSHACSADGSGTAGVRWYELRMDISGNWYIYQQSTYSLDNTYRFMSTMAQNDSGQIALGYNVSSSFVFPGIRVTGRNSCDSLNIMTIPETVVKAGGIANGSYRYGDYNSMLADPTDGSFWMTANYNPLSSNGNWETNVVHFTLRSCSNVPAASFTTSNTSACNSLCVTFTDQSTKDTARLWLFPGGTPDSSIAQAPVICYGPGSYTVTLIAMNSYGNDTVISPNLINVYGGVKPTVTLSGAVLRATTSKSYQWYDSTGAINGGTTRLYVYNHSGWYHVCTVDNSNCASCSDSIYVLFNAVNDISSSNNELALYPNPVKSGNAINMSFSKDIMKGELSIYNVLTEKVYSEKFNGTEKTVQVKLTPGVYLLQVNESDRQYIRKIVVQ